MSPLSFLVSKNKRQREIFKRPTCVRINNYVQKLLAKFGRSQDSQQ